LWQSPLEQALMPLLMQPQLLAAVAATVAVVYFWCWCWWLW